MTTTGPMFLDEELEQRQQELDEEIRQQEHEVVIEDANKTNDEYNKLGKRLLLASEKGRLLEVAHLIKRDSTLVDYKDDDNYTPLHRASYGGHKDCAKYLLKNGANIEAKTTDNWTPLHCAVRWNNILVAESLIQHGADINSKSNGGNTPLHIVASNGRYSVTCDIIQLLLFNPKCDYTIKNNSGDTAFDIAKRSGPFYKFWKGVGTLEFQDDDTTNDIG